MGQFTVLDGQALSGHKHGVGGDDGNNVLGLMWLRARRLT